ncbi:MAG: hypothetical protein U0V56_02895 [Actinomycetota bacterium]
MTRVSGARRGRVALLVAAVSVLAASCAGSGFRYVKDSSDSAIFKIPSAWQVYDEEQILTSSEIVASPQAKEAFAAATWMVAFDAATSPSLDHLFIFANAADQPTGFAQVRPLGLEERDAFSLADIRNALFDVDGSGGGAQAELLSSDDLLLDDGYRGLHVVFNVQDGDTFLTVNQVGLVDPATSTLYLFAIGCEAKCYLDHQGDIDQIASSWTVKEEPL